MNHERMDDMKKLIVYFSRAGENYVGGSLQNVTVGNTAVAAELLSIITGADVFELIPAQEYSAHYKECVVQARTDWEQNARPELRQTPASLDNYDTIYLGYPNYCGTMPMCVFTFLEQFDFTGKTIKPFCTHEGSGLGRSESDIRRLCPGANVEKGLAIYGTNVRSAKEELTKWARNQ